MLSKESEKTQRGERILGAQENHLRSLLIVNEEVVYRSATPKAPPICVFYSERISMIFCAAVATGVPGPKIAAAPSW